MLLLKENIFISVFTAFCSLHVQLQSALDRVIAWYQTGNTLMPGLTMIWMINFIPHFTGNANTYLGLKLIHVSEKGSSITSTW